MSEATGTDWKQDGKSMREEIANFTAPAQIEILKGVLALTMHWGEAKLPNGNKASITASLQGFAFVVHLPEGETAFIDLNEAIQEVLRSHVDRHPSLYGTGTAETAEPTPETERK